MSTFAVSFSESEQKLYLHVHKKAKAQYMLLRNQGSQVVSQNLFKVMSSLLPLRRICSGGSLSNDDLSVVITTPISMLSGSG